MERHRLPAPRTLAITAAIVLPFAALWLHGHLKRNEVERIAASAASEISIRDVGVSCPGPIKRRVLHSINEGSVRFDAEGEPFDETNLSGRTCDGLRLALDAGADLDLKCLAHNCPADATQAAEALAVLAHEAVHLRGEIDEGRTECEARRVVSTVARHFGLTAEASRALAYWQGTDWAERLADRYRAC